MKKPIMLGLVTVLALAFTACKPPAYMLQKPQPESVASITPQSGKAALVITRTTNFGGAIEFKTYLNKKFIGSTRAKSYFAKLNIEPGQQFVSAWGENGSAVNVNFEPGKVYFLQHNVSMGFWKARVVLEALNAKRLDGGDLKGCTFYEFDGGSAIPDLTDVEFNDVIKDADTLVLNADGTATLVPAKK